MLAILLALAFAPPSAASPALVAAPTVLRQSARTLVPLPQSAAPPATPASARVVGFSGGSDLGRVRRLEPPHEQKTVVVTLGVRF